MYNMLGITAAQLCPISFSSQVLFCLLGYTSSLRRRRTAELHVVYVPSLLSVYGDIQATSIGRIFVTVFHFCSAAAACKT